MDLNTIQEIRRPASADSVKNWEASYAWLAGGTWLFSEPQLGTSTLIDLGALGWPALTVSPEGLEIAATCKIVELDQFASPAEWRAPALSRMLSGFSSLIQDLECLDRRRQHRDVAACRADDFAHRCA